MAEVTDWVGQALAGGRYQVVGRLGAGGMAHVYRAREAKLGRDVVIKVPRQTMLADPEFAERFTREIRALVLLEHPGIVKVLDAGSHLGVPFAVMQFLGGGSLRDRQAGGRLALTSLSGWLEGIAKALDFMHAQGIAHRDVKPDNILFDPHGHAYLSDFGIAKALGREQAQQSSLTGDNMVLGTPQYMAPELILGQTYDGRVDQYALAVTVFEVLAGRYPFDGATPAALVMKQKSEAPPALDRLVPGVPRGLSAVLQRGLSFDPAHRYPSCAAFAKAVLSAAAAPVEVEALPALPVPGSRRPASDPVLAPPPRERGDAWFTPVGGPLPPPPVVPVRPSITCPGCHKTFGVPTGAEGKRLRCPSCRRLLGALPKLPPETAREVQAHIDTPGAQESAVGWFVPVDAGVEPVRQARPARPIVPAWLAWTAPRLALGLGAGGLVGLVLEGLAEAVLARKEERLATLALTGAVWALLGLLAGGVAWVTAFHRTGRLPILLGILAPLLGLGCAGMAGAAAAEAGFRVGGPMGLLAAVTALVAIAGFAVGWGEGEHFARGVAGLLLGAVLGEVVAGVLILWPSFGLDRTLLWFAGAGLGVLWSLGLSRLLFAPLVGVTGSALLIAAALPVLMFFTVASTGEVRRFAGHTKAVRHVVPSPDGLQALSASEDDTLRLWEVRSGRQEALYRGFRGAVLAVAFPEAKRAMTLTTERELRVWELGQPKHPEAQTVTTDRPTHAAFAPNGSAVLIGDAMGFIELWDVKEKRSRQARFQAHPQPIRALALSADGKQALTAGEDDVVILWELEPVRREVRRLTGKTAGVRSLAFGPKPGRAASGGADGVARTWDLETGNELRRFEGHRGPVEALAWSPSGARLATASADGTVRLWDVERERELRRLEGHQGAVYSVIFVPGARQLLSAGRDRSVRLWREGR
jgi:WD40 repeat protein/tRNA A-37 threonylcarbamoyl transferase component Bud32